MFINKRYFIGNMVLSSTGIFQYHRTGNDTYSKKWYYFPHCIMLVVQICLSVQPCMEQDKHSQVHYYKLSYFTSDFLWLQIIVPSTTSEQQQLVY
jgi:hypothetical protein